MPWTEEEKEQENTDAQFHSESLEIEYMMIPTPKNILVKLFPLVYGDTLHDFDHSKETRNCISQ